ncbi:MAG: leucine-rich repeat protein [Clostridia bacterium]|nr:leucine-rich repeat protein [Clostridia bacterium]
MKKFAKLLTFAVVLTALIVATLTVGISASESGGSTTTSTPLSGTPTAFWHVDGTTLYITGSAGEDGVLTGGAKNSTGGQDWTSVRTTVTEVKIEATGVTTLSEGFFSYLTAVTKITIPSTVNTFLGGWQMFSACDNLATLDAGNNFGNGVIDVSNITSMGYGNLSYTFNNTKPVIVLNPNLTFNTSDTAFGALGRTDTAEVAVVVNTEKGAISDFVEDIIDDLRKKSGVDKFPKAIVASQSLNITGTLPNNADFAWSYNLRDNVITITGEGTAIAHETKWKYWGNAGTMGAEVAKRATKILVECPNLTAIGSRTFGNFASVTEIAIPKTVTKIGSEVFINSPNISKVYTMHYDAKSETWSNNDAQDNVIDLSNITVYGESGQSGPTAFRGAFKNASVTLKLADDFTVYDYSGNAYKKEFIDFGSYIDGATSYMEIYVANPSADVQTILNATLNAKGTTPGSYADAIDYRVGGAVPYITEGNFTWEYSSKTETLTIRGADTKYGIGTTWINTPWAASVAGELGNRAASEAKTIRFETPNVTAIGGYSLSGFTNVTTILLPDSLERLGGLGGYGLLLGTDNLTTVGTIAYNDGTGTWGEPAVENGVIDFRSIPSFSKSVFSGAFNSSAAKTIKFAEDFAVYENDTDSTVTSDFTAFGSKDGTGEITVYVRKNSTGAAEIDIISTLGKDNKAPNITVAYYYERYISGTLPGKKSINAGFTWTYDKEDKILKITGDGTAIKPAWRSAGWTDDALTKDGGAGEGGALVAAEAVEIVLDCPNLTSIGSYTFMGFQNVTKITIPKTVTTLGGYAVFNGTPNLVTVEAGNNTGDGIVDLSNITTYGSEAGGYGPSPLQDAFANVTPTIYFAEEFVINSKAEETATNFSTFGSSSCTKITAYVKKGSAGETIITKTAAIAAANKAATVEVLNYPYVPGNPGFTWTYDETTKILTISGSGTAIANAWRKDGTGWTDAIAGTGGANACANAEEIVLDCPNLTSIGSYTFMGFQNVTKITIPKTVTTLGGWSVFHTTPNLVTIDAGNNKGDGIIDLSNITVYEDRGTFSTSFSANVTPVIHFAETFEITTGYANFSSFGAPECTQITAYVRIGSTGEDIIEATVEKATAKAESVVVKCYRETVTGTITQATDFSWTFDTDTGVMVISSSTGTKISNTRSNQDYEKYHWNEIKNYVKKITFDTPKLTYIGTYAFGGLTNLEEIVLPATVTKLGNCGVFHQCDNLRTVWTYGGERTVGVIDLRNMVSLEGGDGNQTSETDLGTFAGAFASVSGLKIYLPDDLGAKITKGWDAYTTGEFTVYVTEDSAAAAVVNNANKPSTITVKYYVTIDSGLSSIGWQVKVGSSAVNGLRGVLSFDTAAIEKNKTSGYTLVEIGTVYGTDANAAEGLAVLDTGTPNEGGKATRFVPANDNLGKVAIYWDGGVRNNYLSYKNGILQFCVALTNIPVAQADTDFRMAAYSIWVDDNGEYIYEYCDVSSRALSIYDVTLGLTKYGTINSDSVTAGSTIHSAILDTGKVTTGNLDSTGTLNATYTLYQDKLEGGIVAVIRGSGETPLLAFEGAPYCADYEVSTIVIDTGITKINKGLIDASTTALYYSNDLAAIEYDSLIFRESGQTTAHPYWSNMVVVSPARTEENCGDNAGSAGEYGLWDVSGVTTVNGSRNFQRTAATTLHLPAQIDIQNYMFSANGNLTTVWCGDNEAQTGVIDLSNVTPSTIVENNPEWTLGNGTFSWMNSNITKVILPDGLPKDYALQMSGNYYIQDESAKDGYSIKTGEKISLFENSTCVVVSDEEIPAITEYLIGFVNGKVYSKRRDGTYAVGNHHNVSSYVKKGTDGKGAGETFFAPVFNRLKIGGTALNSYQIYSNGLADEAKELQDAIYARHSVKLTVTDTVPRDRYIKIEKTLTDDSGFTISLDTSNNIIITGPQTGMWIGYAIEYFAYEFVIPVSYDPVSVDALDISSKFSSQIIPFASAVYTKNTLSATLQAVYADSSVCIIGQQVDSKGVNILSTASSLLREKNPV